MRYGGFSTLLYKEVLRFWKVGFQTVAAPVLSALLYLLIFSHVLEGHVNNAATSTNNSMIIRPLNRFHALVVFIHKSI